MRFFDLHNDTARVCFKTGVMPDDTALASSFKKGEALVDWSGCFAVFLPEENRAPFSEYKSILSDFKEKIAGFNKPKCVFTVENAAFLNSAYYVDRIAEDEIKAVTLTWNNENLLAGGAYSEAPLKPLGKEIIGELNRKKIALDLSHLNRKSFFAAGEAADAVFVNHACCYKTHNHPRNLTDEQIKYIADRGGVIGVCFYPEFLGTKYSLEGLWRHINHLLNLGIGKSISLGSDFDGADMSECLDGVDKMPDLYRFLNSRGLSDELLDGIFFKNAQDFFKML